MVMGAVIFSIPILMEAAPTIAAPTTTMVATTEPTIIPTTIMASICTVTCRPIIIHRLIMGGLTIHCPHQCLMHGWAGYPWYGYYGTYFAPYPVYPSPAF